MSSSDASVTAPQPADPASRALMTLRLGTPPPPDGPAPLPLLAPAPRPPPLVRPASAPPKEKIKYPNTPFHPGHPLTAKKLRFLAWHLVALDLVPLAKLSENGHRALFAGILCPLMLVTMHTTSAYTFTPKYRRFLDLITYPTGSITYQRIRYCSDLHSPLKNCVEAQQDEWKETVVRIANLYARFYLVRTAASLVLSYLRRKPSSGASRAAAGDPIASSLNWISTTLVGPAVRSTLYLSIHMLVHRFLMCNVVPKPVDRHRVAYFFAAAAAASMCVLESGKRMAVINRMLGVYLATELGILVEQAIASGFWSSGGLLGSEEEAERVRTQTPDEIKFGFRRPLTPNHGTNEPLAINTPGASAAAHKPLWSVGRPDASLKVAAVYVVLALSLHAFSAAKRTHDLILARQMSAAAEAAFGSLPPRIPEGGLKVRAAAAVVGRESAALAAGFYPSLAARFEDAVGGLLEKDGFRVPVGSLPWGNIAKTVLAGIGMAAVSAAM
ncbi:hypothetical protein DFJ74DRAFT_670361, partial [Hyaloraphidium curvatum]